MKDGVQTANSENGFGVYYSLVSEHAVTLRCPIYHVDSSGNFAASPNLYKISYTQDGYGINTPNVQPNLNAPNNDGLYLTTLSSGECKLLKSLRSLVLLAGLNVERPTYGFHTKWSTDGSLIMFVVRTMEKGLDGFGAPKSVRVQHLFVVSRDGIFAKYILSWASNTFYREAQGGVGLSNVLPDGNHPNWIPHSNRISMNLAVRADAIGQTKIKWQIVSIDVSKVPSNNQFQDYVRSIGKHDHGELPWIRTVYRIGSGHPNFHLNQRYLITDAYTKERDMLHAIDRVANFSVPLRLIDTLTQREVWLAQIPVERYRQSSMLASLLTPWFKKEGKKYRCDLHPVWSPDYRWIVFNGRPTGGERQVMLMYVGDDLSKYFAEQA